MTVSDLPASPPAENHVRPSDVLIVGARITPDVIDMVRAVESALVDAVQRDVLALAQRGETELRAKIAGDAVLAVADYLERLGVGQSGPLESVPQHLRWVVSDDGTVLDSLIAEAGS